MLEISEWESNPNPTMKLLALFFVVMVANCEGSAGPEKEQKIIWPCAEGNPCDAAYCARYPNVECRPGADNPCKAEFIYELRGEIKVIKNCKNAKPCSEACPRIYLPLCGNDGKTYGNECELNVAKCKSKGEIRLKKEGECGE
ncbi:four-domain proteases inhibitor-like [Rhopilema esculentum]|uniref:four-domain proteases inhibitor-like n=1 Tax=Rhopilema esculentum TaxID=499914 RepID=UPI0031DF852B